MSLPLLRFRRVPSVSPFVVSPEGFLVPAPPVAPTPPREMPWSDCKIAFGFDGDEEKLWTKDQQSRDLWPKGWTMKETDGAGARLVVVFRVEGLPREEDGRAVLRVLKRVAQQSRAGARKVAR